MLDVNVFLNDKLLQKTTVSKNRVTIGRSENSDIVLDHRFVSRLHVVIERKNSQYFLKDHSTNGTYLDKTRVKDPQPIPAKCVLGIYPFTLNLIMHPDETTVPLLQAGRAENSETSGGAIPQPPAPQNLHFGLLIGEEPQMLSVYRTIQTVGESLGSILLSGESGTGKELVAKAIHSVSPRRSAPFVAINCAAIPENLIESELFGFEKGAFTGAATSKKGWFEEAQGGTLFLDEIGELPLPAQAKLLRFLQDKTFTRLGGNRLMQADVRVIAATNRDLEKAVQEQQFRSDLYYRLRVIHIPLPPLRDRKNDIPLLSEHTLAKITQDHHLSQRPVLTREAMSKLQTHHWPGNVRQLENALYNAFISTPSPHVIDAKDLDLQDLMQSPPKTFDEINRQLLLKTLKECRWNTTKAAEVLKVSRGTIYYKLKRFGINIKQAER